MGRLARKLSLVTGPFGGPAARHRAAARWSAIANRLRWRARHAWMRTRDPGRPLVLIALAEHLGDLVAAEPIARQVRARHPDARIVWAVRRTYRELIDAHPDVDAVLPLTCLAEWIYLRESVAGLFDHVYDLHISGRDCRTCDLRLHKPGHGVTLANYLEGRNLLGAFCRTAGLPELSDAPRVYTPAAARVTVDRLGLPERFLAVHCTANQAARDWTVEKWRQLARRVHAETGLPVLEVGLRSVIAGDDLPGYLDLCGRLSILETGEVLRRAVAFAGVESGPAHLANAVGTYGVILMGRYAAFEKYVTYSGRYATGENAELIQHSGPAADIPVDSVFAALAARLLPARAVELPATSAGSATDAAALAAASPPTEAR